MQKIETDDNTGWFGTSVDISQNAMYMIVGAMREDSSFRFEWTHFCFVLPT